MLLGVMVDLPSWLLPGVVVDGKYEVVRVLGHGGMGVVCEARHTTLGERVALKAMLAASARSTEDTARFVREARSAFAVRNEHVARVLDAGTTASGDPYLVMELLEGSDLSTVLKERGPLPIADAVEYVAQACEGLSAAHGMGIVHRDVKPANLFLARRPDGSPLVKVLDFGIAKAEETATAGLTQTNTGLGTLPYMSPEQVKQSRDVDFRADVYSMGATLYELLTGQKLFVTESGAELIVQILHGDPTPARMRRPDVPPALDDVMMRATRKSRDERFPSAAAFAAAARAALTAPVPAQLGPPLGSPPPGYGPPAYASPSAPSAFASTGYAPSAPPGHAPQAPPAPPAYGLPVHAPLAYGPANASYPSIASAGGLYRGAPYRAQGAMGQPRPSAAGTVALTAGGGAITTGGIFAFILTAAGGVNSSETGTAIAIGIAACIVGAPLLILGIGRVRR